MATFCGLGNLATNRFGQLGQRFGLRVALEGRASVFRIDLHLVLGHESFLDDAVFIALPAVYLAQGCRAGSAMSSKTPNNPAHLASEKSVMGQANTAAHTPLSRD